MKKNVIVSLADSKYFDLLVELIESIKRFKESENTAICILDAGLNENQVNMIKEKVQNSGLWKGQKRLAAVIQWKKAYESSQTSSLEKFME